jgi:hypothetical protein
MQAESATSDSRGVVDPYISCCCERVSPHQPSRFGVQNGIAARIVNFRSFTERAIKRLLTHRIAIFEKMRRSRDEA